MNMLLAPLVCFGLAAVAAMCSFALGSKKGATAMIIFIMVGGGLAAIISNNALQGYIMFVWYGAPIILVASSLGLAIGVNLKNKNHLLSILLIAPFPYFILSAHFSSVGDAVERKLALEYITNNKQVLKLIGRPIKTYPSSSTKFSSDSNRGRYEFSIDGEKPIFAIVDVSRKSGKPEFSIACITTLSMGQRQTHKDACTQSIIPLPK